jgi:hypothetical protein
MNQDHITAIVAAKSMSSLRPLNVSMIDTANSILRTFGKDEMIKSDFNKALEFIKSLSFHFNGNEMEMKRKRSTMNNNKMLDVLGSKTIVLFHSAILRKTGKNVEIHFNANEKGETMLMNKKTTSDNLSSIARYYANEYGIGKTGTTSDISKVAWKVSPSHHPEIKGKKGVTLKQYIEKYC